MKYRVRLDLSFDPVLDGKGQPVINPDAQKLLDYAKSVMGKAVNIQSVASQEASFVEIEMCRHDEGKPCTLVERVEK